MDIFRGKPKTSEEMAKKLIRSSFQKKKAMVKSENTLLLVWHLRRRAEF